MAVSTNKQLIVSVNMHGYDIENLEEVIKKYLTKKLPRDTSINVRELDGDDHHYFMNKLMKDKNRCKPDKRLDNYEI